MKRYTEKSFIVEMPKVKSIRERVSLALRRKCDCLSCLMNLHKRLVISVILFVICIVISTIAYLYVWKGGRFLELTGCQFSFLFITSMVFFSTGVAIFLSSIIENIKGYIDEKRKLRGLNCDLIYLNDLYHLSKVINSANVLDIHVSKDGKGVTVDYITEASNICKNDTLFVDSNTDIILKSCTDIKKKIVQFDLKKNKVVVIKPY